MTTASDLIALGALVLITGALVWLQIRRPPGD